MGEILFMAIVAVAAIIMFIMTYDFPISIIDKSGGAGLFPRIVIILLLFFMIIRMIHLIKNKSVRQHFVFTEIFKGPRLKYLLITIGYILTLSAIGFIITTVCYLLITINYFYYLQNDKKPSVKNEIIIVVCVIVGTLALYFLFGNVLNILLPKGILKMI